MTVFFVVVIGLGWTASYVYNMPEILFIAVVFSIAMNIIGYWYSDKIVLKISGAKPATREENFDLYTIVENLSITAGLPKPRVYIINDPVPNAFATGRNKEHAVVAVTTGLLSILDRSELEGVIAHELSHIGNKDILLGTIAVVLVGFITLLSDFMFRSTMFGRRQRGDSNVHPILLVASIALMILAPIVATLLQLAISRKREFLADASGALMTRYPEGLANALRKINEYSGLMKRANHATAHLYISNPFGSRKKLSTWSKMFSTHPPAEERINALLGNKQA